MRVLVLRWVITTASLMIAITIVPGIRFGGESLELFLVAAVFGLVNLILRPLLTLLTCPLVLLTLGLFSLVINAWLLLATASLASGWGLDFTVSGFWAAAAGGLVISLCGSVLDGLLQRGGRPHR